MPKKQPISMVRGDSEAFNVDGWEQDQLLQHMLGCINSSGHDLT